MGSYLILCVKSKQELADFIQGTMNTNPAAKRANNTIVVFKLNAILKGKIDLATVTSLTSIAPLTLLPVYYTYTYSYISSLL